MLRCALFDPTTKTLSTGGQELIAIANASDTHVLWVDMESDASTDEGALLRGFNIHPLAIQDALRQRHPPKIEAFDTS